MKKLIFLVSFSILFQSCFSYQLMNINTIKVEKKQKFEIEKVDRTKIKGRIVSKDERKIILENKGSTQTATKEEIYEVNVRRFSILKSSGVVAVATALMALFATSIIAGANSGGWLFIMD